MCEQMERIRNKGKAEGIADGVSIGEYNRNKALAIKMKKQGDTSDKIADFLEVSAEQVEVWLSDK